MTNAPGTFAALCISAAVLWLFSTATQADSEAAPAVRVLEDIGTLPYADRVHEVPPEQVRGRLVPLGAMKKLGGVWQPKASERLDGTLHRYTWQVLEQYASIELMEEVQEEMTAALSLTLLFDCEARACGSSAQWANRIFNERVLYGTEAAQRYRVFAVEGYGERYRLLLYATVRTAQRQYLHAELLQLTPDQ